MPFFENCESLWESYRLPDSWSLVILGILLALSMVPWIGGKRVGTIEIPSVLSSLKTAAKVSLSITIIVLIVLLFVPLFKCGGFIL